MRAIQIVELSGPESLQLADIDEPSGEGVLVDVRAAGVSFPEVLQSRGQYQLKPDLPFVPGSEVGGVVRTDGHGFKAGDRVAAFCMLGGFAETVLAQPHFTFALHDDLDFAQGAGLVLNYHTAHFSLVHRGRLREGETVLVHGAAGGVGTASIQVAKGLGARVLAVVSSDEKGQVASDAGADEVLRSDGAWKDEAKALGGADVVLDPVGGDRFTDSLRALNPDGRLLVVGFTGNRITSIKTNLALIKAFSIVGVRAGEYFRRFPERRQRVISALQGLVRDGRIAPHVCREFLIEDWRTAFRLVADRQALGKVVLTL